ncbi:MAG: sulfotransferase domain-containing protein [Flavobacteriaceae bacterium]
MFGKKKHPHPLEQEIQKLAQFGFQKMGDFRAEDVFILGYPKSGNTLLQHVVAHLVFGLRKDASKSLINSCVTEFYNNPWFFRHNPQHFFKSHELPHPNFKKVIYIVRDGREAVRSYYYMLKNMNQKVSLENLYTSGGETFVGTWANHLETWLENPYNAQILWVRYEDLIQDKKQTLKAICQFLALERTEDELESVMEATSLANMKAMEQDFSWQRSKSHKTWKEDAQFVREGNTKGFESDTQMNQAWVSAFEGKSKAMLQKFMYLP